MDKLLSLDWKNHTNEFIKLLTSIRNKCAYTDVTLACDGQLYNAHKIVLSASSDYFNEIFETILCPNPVIVLKDITGRNLEALLDYMYLGEVNIRQSELSSLIEAAECLKLKGLTVPDSDISDDSVILSGKRKSLDSSPSGRKRLRSQKTEDPFSSTMSKQQEKTNCLIQSETNTADNVTFPSTIEKEDILDDIISIKSETDYINENLFDIDSDLKLDDTDKHKISIEMISTVDEDNDTTQASFIENTDDETTNLREELSCNMVSQSLPIIRSEMQFDKIGKLGLTRKLECCPYCTKKFYGVTNIKRHIRVHTGEKPFVCPYCSYRSVQKGCLKRHILFRHKKIKIF